MQIKQFQTAFKALSQLGLTQVGLNALYKIGLRTGHYRRAILPPAPIDGLQLKPILPAPDPQKVLACLGQNGLQALLDEANEITAGNFRQFGGTPIPLQLAPPGGLIHWTDCETGRGASSSPENDIKLVWEPARFGWTFTLGRAYLLSADEAYPAAFWRLFETYQGANPAYLGQNWRSSQEVGLRLMAWVWAAQIFACSSHSNPARLAALANAVAVHAARIPATLLYARSQNNNHLLSEAAALYTAGLALPTHPQAEYWLKTGRKWLGWCLTHQIDPNGEYIQHSSNYQRLALQIVLWVRAIDPSDQLVWQASVLKNLGLAAGWLVSRLDPISGQLPNLGANDGALVFPFANAEFEDYRPLARAAALAFLPSKDLPGPGAWDEMALWFGLEPGDQEGARPAATGHLFARHAWASLRAVRYTSRPSHADQLHCELWWRGLNIARDAGTYRYSAAPPWDNQLTSTLVHNTVSLNGQEQMTRASRFLYLDWARAEFIACPRQAGLEAISARSTAYARFKVSQTRTLKLLSADHWLVEDELRPWASTRPGQAAPLYRLHWLLPDWDWELENLESNPNLRIHSPHGWISLLIAANQPIRRVGLLRAGQLLCGDGLLSPVFGWSSPSYDRKIPALSLAIEVQSKLEVRFTSQFIFPTTS